MKPEPRIAFVIDALPSLGGGEKVLFTALDVYPQADLFTLVYNQKAFAHTPIATRIVKTSFIDRIPFAHQRHRLFLPIMPFAIEQFNLRHHVSYTYTPMRYAWMDLNLNGTRRRNNRLISMLMQSFRTWDQNAASRVHRFAAISQAVAKRIAEAYRRLATVIYPPVEVDRFMPAQTRENFYITVSRLVPHKRIDLLVQAFSELKLPLLIVGEGSELARLKSMAASNIHFLGYQTDKKVAELLGKARGFVCATEEDFGIAIVEAQAAGCPVVSYGQGGALETVVNEKTGLFFPEQSSASLIHVLQQFEQMHSDFCAPDLIQNARKFDRVNFVLKFKEFIQQTI
jgi:glycosyltransferase involved in cell wall biosynthesis